MKKFILRVPRMAGENVVYAMPQELLPSKDGEKGLFRLFCTNKPRYSVIKDRFYF